MLTIEFIGWVLSAILAISFVVSLVFLAKEPKTENHIESMSEPDFPDEEKIQERPRIKIH